MSKNEHDISIVGVCTHLAEQSVGCVRQREEGGERQSGKREREGENALNEYQIWYLVCI